MCPEEKPFLKNELSSSVSSSDIEQLDDLQNNAAINDHISADRLRCLGKELVESTEEEPKIDHTKEFELLLKLYSNHPDVKRAIRQIRKSPFNSCEDDDVYDHMRKESRQYPVLEREKEVSLFKDLESSLEILDQVSLGNTISKEDEKVLIKATIAHNTLMVSNLRIVIMNASKYYGNKMVPLEDLVQEGNIGLSKAIAKFNVNKGYRFYGLAKRHVKNSIARAFRTQKRLIIFPVGINNKIASLYYIKSFLEIDLGRQPTNSEIVDVSKFSADEVLELQSLDDNYRFSSFEDPINPDNDLPLIDVEFNEYIDQSISLFVELLENRDTIKILFENPLVKLSNREREILNLRFGLENQQEHTLNEIGQKKDLTRERVRQILNKILTNLLDVYNVAEDRHLILERLTIGRSR